MRYIPPGPIASAYIADRSKRALICGPFGSGKTQAALVKLYLMALEQTPTLGIAKSRYVCSRLTRPQLTSTTVKSFQETFKELIAAGFPDVESAALRCTWKFRPEGYKHDVQIDWHFLALETPDDEARVLGLEATAFFIDEARLVPLSLIGKLTGRLRYPAVSKHRSIELATNPWSVDHEFHNTFILNRDPSTAFFHQPGGLDRDDRGRCVGENLQNLNQSAESLLLPWNDPIRQERGLQYYEDQLATGAPEDVLLNVHSKFGVSREGRPVYGDFSYSDHVMPIKYDPALPLDFGHDFGLSSATVILQQTLEGTMRVLAEFVSFDAGDIFHFERLKQFVEKTFPGYRLGRFTADPAGLQRGSDGQDKFAIARRYFITAREANTNETARRVDAVNVQFRRTVRGQQALTIDSKRCPLLVQACIDKFFYKRIRGTNGEHSDVPEKNKWSHVAESLAYAVLGAGCGRVSVMTGGVPGRGNVPEGDAFNQACASVNRKPRKYNPLGVTQ